MTNPNPGVITSPMWMLWTERPGSNWQLSGIYANKPGYHNTVAANVSRWPGNYSVRFALDTQRGPRDKARAIDYTMSDAQMRTYTQRLISAADRNDPRMRGVREFYGTVDSRTVVGRIRDNDTGPYRFSSADSSHLWHIHMGFWAAYCALWSILSGPISVMRNESLSLWLPGGQGEDMLCKRGDTGQVVRALQRQLNRVGFSPGTIDGDYGPGTAAAVLAMRKSVGSSATSGDTYDGTAFDQLQALMARVEAAKAVRAEKGDKGDKGDPGPPGKTPTRIAITGEVIEAS